MSERSNKPVIIWLISGAILVASMVIIGGITRLTHSGLSMVDWHLFMGAIPPTTEAEWQATFDQYKNFPEYQKLNFEFSVEDFKSIFWWEYIHRVLGRVVGIVFIIPFTIFLFQRRFDKATIIKLLILLGLGAFQGFRGWYMVKSGLVNEPSVSHYRLAAHLTTAFIICGYIVWIILDMVDSKPRFISLKSSNWVFITITIAILVQIVYGAFVAGLKAGFFYPTFPLMGGQLTPDQISVAYSSEGISSLFNDITTVQYIHRWLGILVLLMILGARFIFRKSMLPEDRKPLDWLTIIVILQVALGIITLILGVPLVPAVLHQAVALLLFLVAIWNVHRFRNRHSPVTI